MKVRELRQILTNTYKVAALKPYSTDTGMDIDSATYSRITNEANEYVANIINMLLIRTDEMDI